MVTSAVDVLVLIIERALGHIHLAAEDGLERLLPLLLQRFVFLGNVVEIFFHAHHVAMVCNGHATHPVFDGFIDQSGNTGLTIQERVLSVYVKVYKILHMYRKRA